MPVGSSVDIKRLSVEMLSLNGTNALHIVSEWSRGGVIPAICVTLTVLDNGHSLVVIRVISTERKYILDLIICRSLSIQNKLALGASCDISLLISWLLKLADGKLHSLGAWIETCCSSLSCFLRDVVKMYGKVSIESYSIARNQK